MPQVHQVASATRSFDALNIGGLSGDRSPEAPQPVHDVDSRGACARLPQRHLSCGRLRGAAVQHCCCLDSAACPSHSVADFIIVKICLWLTRVPHRKVLTARRTALGKVLHCSSVFTRSFFWLLAVFSHFVHTFKLLGDARSATVRLFLHAYALRRASATMLSGASHKRARPGQVRRSMLQTSVHQDHKTVCLRSARTVSEQAASSTRTTLLVVYCCV